jgi:hypothetical protein
MLQNQMFLKSKILFSKIIPEVLSNRDKPPKQTKNQNQRLVSKSRIEQPWKLSCGIKQLTQL